MEKKKLIKFKNANNLNSAVFFKGLDYNLNNLMNKIDEGFNYLGGFDKFFKKNEKILLKPNLLAADPPEKATTTHPVFFEAVARYFIDNGIKVFAGDSPAISRSINCAKASGILDVCNKLDIRFLRMEKGIKVDNPDGKFVKSFLIAKDIFEVDKIVDLPKFKNHALTVFTGAMKNMFGVIPGKEKALWHARKPDAAMFSNMIIDLIELVKPSFAIMDAILAQEGNGPRGGSPFNLGYLIMSESLFLTDLIAVFSVGYDPYEIHIIKEYAARKKLSLNINDYTIYGDSVTVNDKFEKINTYKRNMLSINFLNTIIDRFFTLIPVIDKSKCLKCGICYDSCPSKPKTISWQKNQIPVFDYKNCIKCFCCQENCPVSAIKIKRRFLK